MDDIEKAARDLLSAIKWYRLSATCPNPDAIVEVQTAQNAMEEALHTSPQQRAVPDAVAEVASQMHEYLEQDVVPSSDVIEQGPQCSSPSRGFKASSWAMHDSAYRVDTADANQLHNERGQRVAYYDLGSALMSLRVPSGS